MKKLFAFSIKTVWELLKYIKPLYELIAAIVKIIKNDKKKDEDENAASKREKSGARSGSSEREQGRPKVNENEDEDERIG